MATVRDKIWLPVSLRQEHSEPTWSSNALTLNAPPTYETTQRNVGLFHIEGLTSEDGTRQTFFDGITYLKRVIKEAEDEIHLRPVWKIIADFHVFHAEICQLIDLLRDHHPERAFTRVANEMADVITSLSHEVKYNHAIYQGLKIDGIPDSPIGRCIAARYLYLYDSAGVSIKHAELRDITIKLHEEIEVLTQEFEQYVEGVLTDSPDAKNTPSKISDLVNLESRYASSLVLEDDILDSLDSKHNVREAGFAAYYAYNEDQANVLTQLIHRRSKLAHLSHVATFSQKVIMGTPFKKVPEVNLFLKCLADGISALAAKDYVLMGQIKERIDPDNPFCISDLHYITNYAKTSISKESYGAFSQYLTLGACIDGVNKIFEKVFFLRCDVNITLIDEVFGLDTYKLQVIQTNFGVIAYIFLDLLPRPGKPRGARHYIVRHGKFEEDKKYISKTYWRPIRVVITMSLEKPQYPLMLTIDEAEDLFSELGSLLPSFLCIKRHQYVFRLTSWVDYNYVCSLLFKMFFHDPRTMKLIYKSFYTGDAPSEEEILDICTSRKIFAASQYQMLITKAAIDQACYGEIPKRKLSDVFRRVQRIYYGLSIPDKCCLFMRDTSLARQETSGKYFNELLMRAIALRVWERFYEDDPLNPELSNDFIHLMVESFYLSDPIDCYTSLLGMKPTPVAVAQILIKDAWKKYEDSIRALDEV